MKTERELWDEKRLALLQSYVHELEREAGLLRHTCRLWRNEMKTDASICDGEAARGFAKQVCPALDLYRKHIQYGQLMGWS